MVKMMFAAPTLLVPLHFIIFLPSFFTIPLRQQTNDCVRHIDRALGAPLNSVVVVAEAAAEVELNARINSLSSRTAAAAAAGVHDVSSYLTWSEAFRTISGYCNERLRICAVVMGVKVAEEHPEWLGWWKQASVYFEGKR